jgi:anti-anti-sigma regulatory factor
MDKFRYIRVERVDGSAVVRFTEPNLRDNIVAECIGFEVEQVMRDERPIKLIVDFTDVRSIASPVISALLVLREKALAESIGFGLCNVPVPIREIYRTLQLEGTRFQVFDSVEQALRAPSVIETNQPRSQMED